MSRVPNLNTEWRRLALEPFPEVLGTSRPMGCSAMAEVVGTVAAGTPVANQTQAGQWRRRTRPLFRNAGSVVDRRPQLRALVPCASFFFFLFLFSRFPVFIYVFMFSPCLPPLPCSSRPEDAQLHVTDRIDWPSIVDIRCEVLNITEISVFAISLLILVSHSVWIRLSRPLRRR